MKAKQTTESDRQWALPSSPWVMRMTWSELLFAHWAIDPDVVAKQLPDGVVLDTFKGQAWVGVVPFLMSDVAPRACPAFPWLSRFLELNVRTYVVIDGKPGVWFWSLDAENPVAVRAARATFSLPYMDAEMSMQQDPATENVSYRSKRTHSGELPACFDADYRPIGTPFHAEPGTLEHWLTARYCLYSVNRKGTIYRGEINHDPWTLQQADCVIRSNTMGEQTGFDFSGDPQMLFAAPIDVRAWWPTRCG